MLGGRDAPKTMGNEVKKAKAGESILTAPADAYGQPSTGMAHVPSGCRLGGLLRGKVIDRVDSPFGFGQQHHGNQILIGTKTL